MKIGLYSGTFDPIHVGHLIIIENVINFMNLDRIILLPTANPPHKLEREITDIKYRMEMVYEAVEDNDKVFVSSYEADSSNVNYSYKTMEYFKSKFPNDDLYFIMGEDSFNDIHKWRNYNELLKNNLIVFKRDMGMDNSKTYEYDNVYFLDQVYTSISSTLIRSLVKNKKSIKYLVLDKVDYIIKKRKLYE